MTFGKLEDMAGLPIGDTPISPSGYFRSVMLNGHVAAEVTGEPFPGR